MADARVAYRVDWTGVAGWGGSKSRQPGGERGSETEDHSSTGESARMRAGEGTNEQGRVGAEDAGGL